MIECFLPGPDATDALAEAFAHLRPDKAVVHLHGDLGAGKSSFARAFLRAMGVEGTIRSPTYTLVERYPLADGREALHLDLYRIGDPGELEFLGIEADPVALWLVEWPGRGDGALPAADLHVSLEVSGDGRLFRADAESEAGVDWLDAVARLIGPESDESSET